MMHSRTIYPGFGSAGPIGIDLGATRLAAVQLLRRGDRRVVAALELPRQLQGQPVTEEIGRLVRVMARRGFRDAPLIVSMPDADVTLAELMLPAVSSGAPLGDMVAEQLGRMRQVEPSSLEVAWWSTQERTAAATATRSLGAGVVSETADALARSFDETGLPIDAIELRPVAIARACRGIAGPNVEVVIDRSSDVAMLIVLEKGEVSYVRKIAPHGIGACAGDTGGFAVDSFVSEVRLTLGYLVHRHPSETVRRVLLLGSDADVAALSNALDEALEIKVVPVLAAPLAQFQSIDTKGFGPSMVVALGLALRTEAP
ncbi:MAG: hypothetical protein SGJ11_11985 [Phycisphaerae bacterium]|nr:hypothetical protein [Phycisphaerae bacterium]